jgi:hypothetical protein
MIDELKMDCNKALVSSFKVLFTVSPGGTEKNKDKPEYE